MSVQYFPFGPGWTDPASGLIDPRNYNGAHFDGVQDDTLSIQSAIAAAALVSGGGTVAWPPGYATISAPLNIPPTVSIVCLGQATVRPLAGYTGDCFVFLGGTVLSNGVRYFKTRYQLPSIMGTFANGLRFKPNSVMLNIDIPYIGGADGAGPGSGPVNATLFEYTNTQGIYGVWIRFNQIRFCTYAFKCVGARDTGLPSVLQGLWVWGAFVDACKYGIYFTDTVAAPGERNYNVIDNCFEIKSMDGSGIDGVTPQVGAQGITFDTCRFDGGSNQIRCESYFGNYPTGGGIVKSNGGSCGSTEFVLAPYAFPSNAYGMMDGLLTAGGNSNNTCKVNGASGFIARGITANTAPNTRATFNAGAGAGVPIYANRYDLALPVPNLSTGQFATFYVYHPLTTGCPNSVKCYARTSATQPVVITDCVDESVVPGIAGPNPNEIAIRVTAFGTVAAFSMPVTLEVGL